jgi:urease gamma subunit
VAPAYLVGYQMSVDYMKRLMDMDIEMLLMPHQGLVIGREKCRALMEDALRSAELLKDLILNDHRRGRTLDEITKHYEEVFFTDSLRKLQPPKAFYLNAGYLIQMVINEFEKQ